MYTLTRTGKKRYLQPGQDANLLSGKFINHNVVGSRFGIRISYRGPRGGKLVYTRSGQRSYRMPKPPMWSFVNGDDVHNKDSFKYRTYDNHVIGPRGGYYGIFGRGEARLRSGQKWLYRPDFTYYRRYPKRTNVNTGEVNFKDRPIMMTSRGKRYVNIGSKVYKYSIRRNEPTGRVNFKDRPVIRAKRGGRDFVVMTSRTGKVYHKFFPVEARPGYNLVQSKRSDEMYLRKQLPYNSTTFVNIKGRKLHRDAKGDFVFSPAGRRIRKIKYPDVPHLPPEMWNLIRAHM